MSKQITELLEIWRKDSDIDRTEPGRALLQIPKLHSKYLDILSHHRILCKEAEFKYNKIKKIKWEYFTGRISEDELKEHGWEPFPFTIKSEIGIYLDGDEDLQKYSALKTIHEEIVDLCERILKELNSRTFQLRSFIDWEKFTGGN